MVTSRRPRRRWELPLCLGKPTFMRSRPPRERLRPLGSAAGQEQVRNSRRRCGLALSAGLSASSETAMASDRNTFLGVAACDLALPLGEADVVIFGAADATPHLKGRTSHAANGPAAIRNALRVYQTDLARWDFDQDGILLDPEQIRVVDGGDLATSPEAPEQNRNAIRSATRKILKSGAVPMLLGGDDSVPIPFFEAFEDMGKLTILQIDAHLDWKDQRDGSAHTFSSTMRRASELPWGRTHCAGRFTGYRRLGPAGAQLRAELGLQDYYGTRAQKPGRSSRPECNRGQRELPDHDRLRRPGSVRHSRRAAAATWRLVLFRRHRPDRGRRLEGQNCRS